MLQKAKGKFRLLDEAGPALAHSLDKMVSRVRVLSGTLAMSTLHSRTTSRIRALFESKTFASAVYAIKGGVGTAVLPTTVFVKHLVNKLIFRK